MLLMDQWGGCTVQAMRASGVRRSTRHKTAPAAPMYSSAHHAHRYHQDAGGNEDGKRGVERLYQQAGDAWAEQA